MQRLRALPRLLAIPAALKKGIALIGVLKQRARAGSSRRDAGAQSRGRREHGVTGVEVAASERHEARSRLRCRRARLSPASRNAARRSRRLRIPFRRRCRAAMARRTSTKTAGARSRASIWRAMARACAAPMPPSARAGSPRSPRCTTPASKPRQRRHRTPARRTRALHALRRRLAHGVSVARAFRGELAG